MEKRGKMLFLMGRDVVLSVGYRVDTQFCYSFSFTIAAVYRKASNPFLTTIGVLVAQRWMVHCTTLIVDVYTLTVELQSLN